MNQTAAQQTLRNMKPGDTIAVPEGSIHLRKVTSRRYEFDFSGNFYHYGIVSSKDAQRALMGLPFVWDLGQTS